MAVAFVNSLQPWTYVESFYAEFDSVSNSYQLKSPFLIGFFLEN